MHCERTRRTIVAALLALASVGLTSPGWAVVTNVQLMAGNAPQTGSDISVFASPQPAPGERPIATGRTDAAGRVTLDIPDQYASDGQRRCLLLVARDAQGRERRVPCFYLPRSGGALAVDTATGQVAAGTSAVTVLRRGQPGIDGSLAQLGLSYGHTGGSVQNSVAQNGVRFEGSGIDVSTPSLRLDGRLFFGALANMGDVGNVGPVGNVGNLGTVGPSNCYLGMQGGIGLDDGDEGMNLNLHAIVAGVLDTFLRRESKYTVTPYVGCSILQFPNHFGSINLNAGVRYERLEYTFRTLESQGGGNDQRVTKTENAFGPAVGLEYNLDLDPQYYGGFRGGLQLGAWGHRSPGTEFRLNTQPFNLDYDVNAQDSWLWTFRAGAYIKLGRSGNW